MPRRPAAAPHWLARLRAWLGLGQTELALYLGVSQPLIQAVEVGRSRLGPDPQTVLLPLLRHLPPPEAEALAAAEAAALPLPHPPGLADPPDADGREDLDLRRLDCLAQAARLRREAARLAQQATVAARWAAALPTLLPPDPDGPPGPPPDPALAAALALRAAPAPHDPAPPDPQRPAAFARWLRGWLLVRAQPLPPAATTRYCRLLARAAGLQAEADALAACLPPPVTP